MPAPRITLTEHLGLTPSKKVKYMHTLGTIIQARWKSEADRQLSDVSASTRTKYRDAVEVVDYNERSVVVRISNKFVAMFEQGLGPSGVGSYGVFDMRNFLLNRPKGKSGWPKTGKKGKWRPIPFVRSKAQMEETVRKSSTDLAHNSAELSKRVNAVREMRKQVTRVPETVKGKKGFRVIRSGVVPRAVVGPRTVFAINTETGVRTSATATAHSTDLIAGTRRQGGKFVTFRVISYGGKPWYHPGIRPRRIARMVMASLGTLLPDPRNPKPRSS